MKLKVIVLLLSCLIYSIPNFAVKPVTAKPVLKSEQQLTKQEARQLEKAEKKQAKLEKRLQKLEKKLAKKGIGNGQNLWDNDNFRLGAYIALGGLVLRLLAFIPLLGGIISLIGTLIFLIGLGLMVWTIIDK